MLLNNCNVNISFTPRTIVVFAVMLLTIPVDWMVSWLLAAAVHELFHCIAVLVCGKRIYSLGVDISGAVIQTQTLTYGQSALCSFAGPFGGLLLTCIHRFPRLALCAFVQSLYNLLPVYPLDGGRILDSLAKSFFGEHVAKRLCSVVSGIVIGLLLIFCVTVAVMWNTCMPLLVPFTVFVQSRRK